MAIGKRLIENEKQKAVNAIGGIERLRIISVLAATLGLDSADKATISAVSAQLKQTLSLSNTEIGALLAVVSLVGALVTFPAGALADRMHRKTILIVAVGIWALGMIGSGLAHSYMTLLIARLFLGAVTAAAWPCIASLSGDLFPARERASIYGLILTGELVGTAIGFFISAEISGFINWHWAFYIMAFPSVVLVWALWRYLPEPERGGQSWLTAHENGNGEEADEAEAAEEENPPQKMADESGVPPRRELVRDADRGLTSWLEAMRYCLRIPSYRRLVITSALAYFFFSSVRGFAMIYFQQHYGLSHEMVVGAAAVIGIGALVGVIGGGRISEFLLRRGQISARVIVPVFAFFAAFPFIGFGIWITTAWLGICLLTIGAGALAAAMAPIDAARLDVIESHIWGRAESGRAALRYVFEGISPLLLGAISGLVAGSAGLTWGFLIMLLSVLAAGILALPMRKTYPRDVATAAAATRKVDEKEP